MLPCLAPVLFTFKIQGVLKGGQTESVKSLLHGQKDRVFFNGYLIYILKQERFRAFRMAGGV
jgi:hypothetical protein